MAKYKTMQGEVIELTDKEYYAYPYNSKLMKMAVEIKPKTKKKVSKKTPSKGDD
jgi:hypothetical protein|tara:strand:+ start:17046 stop:17207 length:162 start_codon:yes stop_codon:yes gene_type:complete